MSLSTGNSAGEGGRCPGAALGGPNASAINQFLGARLRFVLCSSWRQKNVGPTELPPSGLLAIISKKQIFRVHNCCSDPTKYYLVFDWPLPGSSLSGQDVVCTRAVDEEVTSSSSSGVGRPSLSRVAISAVSTDGFSSNTGLRYVILSLPTHRQRV